MVLTLSWNLFVAVFFSVIVAYSFIIGKNQTLKIIIASYIAILASDGIGNLIQRYLIGDQAVIKFLSVANNQNALIFIKIGIFVMTVILITNRGRFQIDSSGNKSILLNAVLSLTYGVLSAGLLISTVLIYASGASLVRDGTLVMNEAVKAMYNESFLVKTMIDNYNIWFSLPAITFVLSSLIRED